MDPKITIFWNNSGPISGPILGPEIVQKRVQKWDEFWDRKVPHLRIPNNTILQNKREV